MNDGNQECPVSIAQEPTCAFLKDKSVTDVRIVKTAPTNDGYQGILVSGVLQLTPAFLKQEFVMELMIAEMDLMKRKKPALVLKGNIAVQNHPVQMFLDHVSHQNGFVTRMVFGTALAAQTRPTVRWP